MLGNYFFFKKEKKELPEALKYWLLTQKEWYYTEQYNDLYLPVVNHDFFRDSFSPSKIYRTALQAIIKPVVMKCFD